MANLEELVISLVAETSGLRSELSKATTATKDATKKMDSAIEEFSKNSSSNLSFFETSMATMTGFIGSQLVLGAINKVGEAIGFLSESLKAGGKDAIEEEKALVRLANSMALSGQYSEKAMISLQVFSGEMEELTGVSDHVIASNLSMLSSLTRLDSEGLKQAQKAALDMSVALGMDLDSATRLVAKGIEGNTDAFQRYGINIKKGANQAENFTNVLSALNKGFGGAAEGAAKTFDGSVTNLSNAWGNLNEALATTVTKNPVVMAMMQQITNIINTLTKSTQTSSEIFQKVLGAALLGVNEILYSFAAVLDDIFSAFGSDKMKGIRKAFDDLGNAGAEGFNQIGQASEATLPTIAKQAKAVEELNEKQKELLKTKLEEQEKAHDQDYSFELEQRKTQLDLEMALLEEHGQNKYDLLLANLEAEKIATAEHHEIQKADLEAKNAAGLLTDEQYQSAKKALKQKQALEDQKISANDQKLQKEINMAKLQGMSTFFQGLSALTQSSSKELQSIGKAAAIADTTMKAYMAIQNALATVPYPFNFAAAAGVGVQAFANVAKIAGIGFNEGGTLVGGGANRDTIPATLTKGETVITRDLTDKLDNFFSGNSGQSGPQTIMVEISLKDQLVEFIEAKILERQSTNISLLGAV